MTDPQQVVAILSTTLTGTIINFSKAAECLLGFSANEVVGKLPLASFHDPAELEQRSITCPPKLGTSQESVFRLIVADTAPGCVTEGHWTYVHRNGRRIPIHLTISSIPDASGQTLGYVFVLQEVHRNTVSTKFLQHQAQLLDLANDAILIRDLERDTITYWNEGAVRLYGWSSREADGAYIHDFLQTVFPKPLAEIRKTFLSQGFWSGELLHTTRKGEHISVSSRWTLLKDSNGEPSGSLELNTDITQQKRTQEALKSAHEELDHRVRERTTELSDANRRLQILSQRLMEIQESERRAIARDLHDEIGQALTAIKMNLREIGENSKTLAVEKQVSDSLQILDQVIQHTRNLALDLRPSMLDELGLIPALRWYVGRQAKRAGWRLDFLADEVTTRPAADIEISCFRLTQEALTNVARHAKATEVEVHLHSRPTRLDLTIRDNGIGFDVKVVRANTRAGTSIGLSGMEERVRLAGGHISILSTPMAGTEVHASFPLNAEERR